MSSDDTTAAGASSPRTLRALLILAAVVVTVLVITVCVLAVRTPATAAEGWTASPGKRTAASMSLSPCTAPPEPPAGGQPTTELVGEQRGLVTLSVRTDENSDTLTCLATQIDDEWTAITIATPYDEAATIPVDGAMVRSDALLQTDPTAVDAPETSSQHVVAGEVGDLVTAVTLQTAAGDTEATLSNGWFGAWWPTEDADELDLPVTAVLSLEDGTTRTLTLPASGSPAPGG